MAALTVLALALSTCFTVAMALAKPDNPGPPDIQRKVFIHYAKPAKPEPPQEREAGFYKLIGAKWKKLPISLEVNPSNSFNLDTDLVVNAIKTAAGEWDDGAYSNWGGVTATLFNYDIAINESVGYYDLAWTSDKMDGKNTLLFGDYPTEGVIAVTIVWYNSRTKEILEFDIVFDTNYTWGNATVAENVMDLQNIATHELGHALGLDDVYQSPAYQETMYGYSSAGETIKRSLHAGDKAGIKKLYG